MTLSFTIRHQYQIGDEPILLSLNTTDYPRPESCVTGDCGHSAASRARFPIAGIELPLPSAQGELVDDLPGFGPVPRFQAHISQLISTE